MILSASRRTDIPCYYPDWFLNRLKDGYVLTRNPLNRSQVSRIKLSPDTIDCIVFWTKDPAPMIDKLPMIDILHYKYYFQFTLTPYQKDIERNLRRKEEIIQTFQQLSDLIGKERMIWRYDPIIINHRMDIVYHCVEFEKLCNALCGYTDVCMISFVDNYRKLSKQVKESIICEIDQEQMREVSMHFFRIAQRYGINLQTCCESIEISGIDVASVSCIDRNLIERICGHSINKKKDKSQRPGCRCIQSVDIGVYNTCMNGCIYCYANHSDASIQKNLQKHKPDSDILIGKVESEEVIRDR